MTMRCLVILFAFLVSFLSLVFAGPVPNTDCLGVPFGSAQYDACNVCDGDGLSCADCIGVPFGSAQYDACNVCDGDGLSCADCLGVPLGSAQYDACNVCDGDGLSCADCLGVPLGSAQYDACNVCDGDGLSCADCLGVPLGSAQYDACNVCDGDGLSCADCLGVPLGSAQYDACNVCDGDGLSCADCLGVPLGSAQYDACNVCDGDGLSCLDCRGTPFGSARYDACNVCDGDGSSCGACCTDGISCSSLESSSCPTGQFFVPTSASSCSSELCCPIASSSFDCPSNSPSAKLIVYVDVFGTLEARTVCVNGWENSDASVAANTVVTRTLTVTSSDGSFEAQARTYACRMGSANRFTGFPDSFDCSSGQHEISYTDCLNFCLSSSSACIRKRQQSATVVGSFALFSIAARGFGDPHFRGANGAKFNFRGEAGGIYALFVAPTFAVNMRLAAAGPKVHFMTEMGLLVGNTSVTIGPWFSNRHHIADRLATVGAKVTFADWSLTVTLCNNHVLSFGSHSSPQHKMNYLNFGVSVPGCHDAYGGALGQTYQCKYVLTKKHFEWSIAHEKAFRVDALTAPSRSFAADADCAHEDEFQGTSLHGESM